MDVLVLFMSSGGKLMKKLFACKAKNDENLATMKRSTVETENKEVQEIYGHSHMQMDRATKLRETIAKGQW